MTKGFSKLFVVHSVLRDARNVAAHLRGMVGVSLEGNTLTNTRKTVDVITLQDNVRLHSEANGN